ncbi:MAG: hypothetical protein QM500_07110 [Methylococcales bacterium]
MSDGKLTVSVGSSRSGKTAFVIQQVKKDKRVIVWNIKDNEKDLSNYDERNNFKRVYKKTDLINAIKENPTGDLRICYVPSNLADFEWWAKLAYTWGRAKECTIIAEELADVTTPAKAPPAWGMLVRKILGYGCNVYAITQRPAESDKTIMGNASIIHCGRLSRFGDRRYMAQEMDIHVEKLNTLKPLEWVEKHDVHNSGGEIVGKLKF